MTTPANRSYRTSKARMFLLFLALSAVIWALAKFSKESTATVSAELDYINAPDTISVASNTIRAVSFDITGNGFQFLSYKLKQPVVAIDLAAHYVPGEEQIVIRNPELAKIITTQLGNKTLVRNVTGNDLQIQLDVMSTRKVPVLLDDHLSYADGFRTKGKVRIVPDSVVLTGPSKLLEGMEAVQTEPMVANQLAEDYSTTLKLNAPDTDKVRYSAQEVEVTVPIGEFTQKTLAVPIQLINVPAGTTVQLIPQQAEVRFEIAVDRYQSVNELDFEVRCDFSKKHGSTAYLVPELVGYPEELLHVDLITDKLEYLIFE